MQYVIIGNSAAAIGAIEGIRRADQDNPITVISTELYHTYSRPLISYYLSGKVNAEKMYYRGNDFYEKNKVRLLLNTLAESIDTVNHTVSLANKQGVVHYDKLLLATGSRPFSPVDTGTKINVFPFYTFDHAKKIKQQVTSGKTAVVIGAGLIGLKAAEALAMLKVKTTVIDIANRVLASVLDHQAANIVKAHFEANGVNFELSSAVQEIAGKETATAVVLSNGKRLLCDMIIMAAGVRPDTMLVQDTPIILERGIIVDSNMRTNIADVFAAGDVSQGFDVLAGMHRVLPLWPNAYLQGETAGNNMAGKIQTYPGGFAMNAINFFGLPILTAGTTCPLSNGYEEIVQAVPLEKTYNKVVLKDNALVGFICINSIDRAGILTGLIKNKINVSDFKDKLIKRSIIYFPPQLRSSLIKGSAAK